MCDDSDIELVRSFGRCAAGTSQVYRPTTVHKVNEVFDIARKAIPRRRIVIRGGGHSFDGQAVHDQDNGSQIILSSDCFDPQRIKFDTTTVTLGAGVQWGAFFKAAVNEAQGGKPLRIPGSMQTGRVATVGGTLAGDCLSRFSGTGGKESFWIESFQILTPTSKIPIPVTAASDPELFYSVIGGHGYIGFVTEATYRLIEIDPKSIAHSHITTHLNFHDLIQKQLELVQTGVSPRAISSAWYTKLNPDVNHPEIIKGAVFDSFFGLPSEPIKLPFALYTDIESPIRNWIETMWATNDELNLTVHEFLFDSIVAATFLTGGRFENDLLDFLFFMDGNTVAKKKFEELFFPAQFPIVQQTFIIPPNKTEEFAEICMRTMAERSIRPTECDMLFVQADKCLMSGSYYLDGFAVTLGFEPVAPQGCPPPEIPQLLRDLSKVCLAFGGRLHLPKNLQLSSGDFRNMFLPQIQTFEDIKRKHDPELLLGNKFSDYFFQF
jgi:decaprenylphospho-beta-D-ribofuranose 2-oxidase